MASKRNWGRFLLSILIIPLVLSVCISVSVIGMDSLCYSTNSQLLPQYPEATIVFEQHSFLRAFGMGDTVMILETDDELETVREWQARKFGSVARAAAQGSGRIAFSMTDANYSVIALDDRPGSQITLSSACAG